MELAALLTPQKPGQSQLSTDEQLWQLTYSMLFLTLSGFVLSWLYQAVDYAYQSIRKKLVCSITLASKDELFKIVRSYLTHAGYLKGSMTELKVQPKKKKNAHWWDYEEFEKSKTEKMQVEYLPGPGSHIFEYKGKQLWISINEQQTVLTGWENKPTKYETLSICTYGTDTKILKELVQEAMDFNEEKDTSLIKIYQVHKWGGNWNLVQQKKPRAIESVVLDTNIADQIINDVQKFLDSGEKYVSKDVPYRRGYLLYGPPGTGKTSFVQVIAGQLKMDLCYLNLAGGNLDDDALTNLLSQAPERSIILLEDIDAIFVERVSVQDQSKKQQGITFSGLLNALDGIRSQEGRVLIMTTNHRERLDPALLRPGRADLHFELNYASENQMKNLLKKFYPDATDRQAQDFADQLPEFKLSMAKLQGHFLKYRDNLDEAIGQAKLLLEIDQQIKDMSIEEWLRRLNFSQYVLKFKKIGNVKTVSDLKYIQEGDLIEYGFKVMTDRKRVMDMMNGDQEVKVLFQMQNITQIRQIVSQFVKDDSEAKEFVEMIGEEQITGWQLIDIFDANRDLDVVKLKLYNKIQHNQAIAQGQLKEEIEDEEDNGPNIKSATSSEEKAKEELLSNNVETFLKQFGFEDCIPKLEEHDIADPEVFFGLTEDEMITNLGITKEGRKYKFKRQIKELKEQLEKKKAEREEQKMKRRTGETFELLQKRSSVIY
eukprot:403356416